MKRLFFGLLVINVLFFLWWQFGGSGDDVVVDRRASDASGGLILLSEVAKSGQQESQSKDETIEVSETAGAAHEYTADTFKEVVIGREEEETANDELSGSVCYSIGPVDNRQQADEIMLDFTGLAQRVEQRVTTEPAHIGYRVYIPPLSSLAEARTMLQRLKARGIKDSAIIRHGEYKNGISLGVFSRQEGAQRHLNAMAEKGFTVMVADRYRNRERFWLDIQGVYDDGRFLSKWSSVSNKYHGIKKQLVKCKE